MSSKTELFFLRRFADVTKTSAGEAIGHDASFMTRFMEGTAKINLGELDKILAAVGAELVETKSGTVTMSAEKYDALKLLAIEGLSK